MTTVQGKTISECFELVSRVNAELAGLRDTLSNLLISSLGADKTLPFRIASDATSDSRTDDSGWVYTDFAWSLPLKASGRGSSKPRQYFGYQISMAGDGTAIPGCSEPLLHVFSWDSPANFKNKYYLGFPLDGEGEIVDGRLLVWGDLEAMDWNERAWTYSLRLTALNSSDLKKYIVMPALALLKGADAVSALPDGFFDGVLVRYPAQKELLVM
jgi:hypothetical protein